MDFIEIATDSVDHSKFTGDGCRGIFDDEWRHTWVEFAEDRREMVLESWLMGICHGRLPFERNEVLIVRLVSNSSSRSQIAVLRRDARRGLFWNVGPRLLQIGFGANSWHGR